MFKFKTKKSDEVKTSPLTKKSNAVAKATMFLQRLLQQCSALPLQLLQMMTRLRL